MYETIKTWTQDGFILEATTEVDEVLTPNDLEDPDAYDSIEDYERRVESFGTDWCYVIVWVRVSLEAVPDTELGSALLGGVESGGSDEYLNEIADELADEAIEDAREHIRLIGQALAS